MEDTAGLYAYMTADAVLRITLHEVVHDSLPAIEFEGLFAGGVLQRLLDPREAGLEVTPFGAMRVLPSVEGFSVAISVQR